MLVTGPMRTMPQEADFASHVHGSAHANAAARVVCTPCCRISRGTIHKDITTSPAKMRARCAEIVEASSSQKRWWVSAKPIALLAARRRKWQLQTTTLVMPHQEMLKVIAAT